MFCFLTFILHCFSFVILFYNGWADSSGEFEIRRCKPIPFEACKDVGYNYTALPNLVGIELESEAEYSLSTFKPLVKFGCSSQLQFLLCSLYAPMCTPQVPTLIGPCKSLCEGVRDRCSPVLRGFGFPWPAAFNCSSLPPENNERHMCMEGPKETVPLPPTLPPPPTPQHSRMRCSHLAHPQLYVYLNATGRCAPLCGADITFSNEDKVFAAVWMSIWGVATFFVGLGALATLLLDSSLFRYPDRAAVHICFCYALVAAGYLVRLGVGGGTVACRKDPELGISLLITEGALNTPCVAVFLLLYYFSLSAGAWWVIYCGCCLLRVWRNVTHEEFIQRSSILHALGWGTPSVVTVACLVLRKVEADELTSTCFAGGYDAQSLIRWVIAPQLLFLIIGASLIFCVFATCWRNRPKLGRKNLHHAQVDVAAARMGVMGVLYMVPCTCLLSITFYEMWQKNDIWASDLSTKLGVEIYLLKIFMGVAPGLFFGLFLVNRKVLDSWKRSWGRLVHNKPKSHLEFMRGPPLIGVNKPPLYKEDIFVPLKCPPSKNGVQKHKAYLKSKKIRKIGPETQI